MELRERNYRSRLGSKRSTKAKREADDESTERAPAERYSISDRVPRNTVDYAHQIKKWAPIVVVAAIVYWVVTTYIF